MKKYFYSIWFRVASALFIALALTLGLFAFCVHLITVSLVIEHFQLSRASFLVLLFIICAVFGLFVSTLVIQLTLKPIRELTEAIQKVADGNYETTLNARHYKGEIRELCENFNRMVHELNSTQMLHSDFIANVSHEFKTPLAAISGYATLLQDDTLSVQERDEYIETIVASTKELSHMTQNILELSQLENQTILSEQEDFRLDEQIREVVLALEPLWAAKNLSIDPELDNLTWHGNRELMNHVWRNLLDNAVKFTPRGGEIRIRATRTAEEILVTFQDSGVGMPPDVQAHIFDKFYQGDASHKRKGNGLGLALVRQIVVLHGGSVAVDSTPDLGSTFLVHLPATVTS